MWRRVLRGGLRVLYVVIRVWNVNRHGLGWGKLRQAGEKGGWQEGEMVMMGMVRGGGTSFVDPLQLATQN